MKPEDVGFKADEIVGVQTFHWIKDLTKITWVITLIKIHQKET